jgi:hypothetical protein
MWNHISKFEKSPVITITHEPTGVASELQFRTPIPKKKNILYIITRKETGLPNYSRKQSNNKAITN